MNLSNLILKSFGWKVQGAVPAEIKKFVVVVAPHTSMWDFFIGFLVYKALGIKAHYLIKKEMFFFPISGLVKKLGGIPVDRHNKNTVVEDVVKLFETHENFCLTITPEGTRSLVRTWKSGFHRIALAARVPVVAGFLDYEKKIAGIIGVVELSGDFEKDLSKIQGLYKGISGKHTEKFYLPE